MMNETTDPQDRRIVVIGLALAAALVVGLVAAGGVGAEPVAQTGEDESVSPPGESAIIVELDKEGDAMITATLLTYDLTDEAAEATFDELRADEEWRATRSAQFEDQWGAIAADAAEQTDREMSVADAHIEFDTVEDTGIVRLSMTWTNLAATEDDQLVVTEPFSTMEESPQALYIVLPDDHELATVESPDAPSETTDDHLRWETESELSGFSLAASSIDEGGMDDGQTDDSTDDEQTDDRTDDEQTDDGTTGDAQTDDSGTTADDDDATEETTDDGFGPGFGILAVVGALLAVTALARRR